MPVQPSNTWSIQLLNADGSIAGDPQTLADLGIDSAQYDLNNLAADTLTFTVGGRALDAASLWPFGQLLALLRPDGPRFFVGRVEPWSREGTPESQNHLGRVVNPWWYLSQKIYEQRYSVATGNWPNVGQDDPPTYEVFTTSRVVLNVLYSGQPGSTGFYSCTTGAQIADAVNWAILKGAPIKLGVTDPATQPFSDFQKGIFCADVIKLMFRKEPDFVMDWDYTTLPFPTVHFRKAASLVPLTIDLTDVTIRERVRIKERPDWQRSYVHICYDTTSTQDNGSYIQISNDTYPDPIPAGVENAFRGVDLYCDLSGASATTVNQQVTFTSIGGSIFSPATWARWKSELNDPGILSVDIVRDSGNPTLPDPKIVTLDEFDGGGQPVAYNPANGFELVDGQVSDWVPGMTAQRVRATAVALVVKDKGQKVKSEAKYISLSHDFVAVSKDTGGQSMTIKQTGQNVSQYAEPIPVGLAKAMWTSWQNLAIEGSFTEVAAVCNNGITRSNCLNFLTSHAGEAGRPDWRNVQALVQRISGNLAVGLTNIEFGAPLRITGNDLIDAVRATRFRMTTIDLAYLFGGTLGGSGSIAVKHCRKTHARHSQHGGTHYMNQVISANPQPTGGDPFIHHDGTTGISTFTPPGNNGGITVTLDPSKAKGSDGNFHPLFVQEQKVCTKVGGILKQRTVLALTSEVFKAPDDPA